MDQPIGSKKTVNRQLVIPELAAAHLLDSIEKNDVTILHYALTEIVKAHGISEIAARTGIARQAIYAMISRTGNPTLQNIHKILKAIGLELTVRVKKSS